MLGYGNSAVPSHMPTRYLGEFYSSILIFMRRISFVGLSHRGNCGKLAPLSVKDSYMLYNTEYIIGIDKYCQIW